MTLDTSHIEETARLLLRQLRMAYAHADSRTDVSLSRGVVFLKRQGDKDALSELLAFLRDHVSPSDTGHLIRENDTAHVLPPPRVGWGPSGRKRTKSFGWGA